MAESITPALKFFSFRKIVLQTNAVFDIMFRSVCLLFQQWESDRKPNWSFLSVNLCYQFLEIEKSIVRNKHRGYSSLLCHSSRFISQSQKHFTCRRFTFSQIYCPDFFISKFNSPKTKRVSSCKWKILQFNDKIVSLPGRWFLHANCRVFTLAYWPAMILINKHSASMSLGRSW